jgi:hypothetical protein
MFCPVRADNLRYHSLSKASIHAAMQQFERTGWVPAAFTSRPVPSSHFHYGVAPYPLHESRHPHHEQQLYLHSRQLAKRSLSTSHNLGSIRQGTTTMLHEAPQSRSPQPSADATLALFSAGQPIPQAAILDNSLLQPRTSGLETLRGAAPHSVLPSVEVTAPAPIQANVPANNDATKATANQQPFVVASRTLLSLLHYVDVQLMTSVAYHDHPTHPGATCCICFYQWDIPINGSRNGISSQPALFSTFLPLSACSHWVHYRCLIWLASRSDPQSRDKCPQCHTRLYQWEGIAALTLATRTGIEMEDNNTGGTLTSTSFDGSDRAWYESDCVVIESIIQAQFFLHLDTKSKYIDLSPNLVQCFYDVLDALKRMSKPTAPWLKFETKLGHLLWGMLVTIKMRRYLIERHGTIQGTEGWRRFEEGRQTLQGRMLEEVRTG